jgi:hypothetical protein
VPFNLSVCRYKRGYKNVINKGIELNEQGENCELMMETSGHGALKSNWFLDDGAYMSVKIIIEAARRRWQGRPDIRYVEHQSLPVRTLITQLSLATVTASLSAVLMLLYLVLVLLGTYCTRVLGTQTGEYDINHPHACMAVLISDMVSILLEVLPGTALPSLLFDCE